MVTTHWHKKNPRSPAERPLVSTALHNYCRAFILTFIKIPSITKTIYFESEWRNVSILTNVKAGINFHVGHF